MKSFVRTTIVYGAISSVAVMLCIKMLSPFFGTDLVVKLIIWLDICVYTCFLARWSGMGLTHLALLFVCFLSLALLPSAHSVIFGLGVFSWIRSGICFSNAPLRAMLAETVTIFIGAGLLALFKPSTPVTWAIGIWLFYLVQALYFFIVPVTQQDKGARHQADSFETAHREARRILDGFNILCDR